MAETPKTKAVKRTTRVPATKVAEKKDYTVAWMILIGGIIAILIAANWEAVKKHFSKENVFAGNMVSQTAMFAATPVVVPAPAPATATDGETVKVANAGGVTVTQNCGTPPKPVVQAKHTTKPSAKAETVVRRGTFWGWVHPYATSADKKTCYADREISGMPPQCSQLIVEPSKGGETEVAWRNRMGQKQGLAVGMVTDRGVIASVTSPDVNLSTLK